MLFYEPIIFLVKICQLTLNSSLSQKKVEDVWGKDVENTKTKNIRRMKIGHMMQEFVKMSSFICRIMGPWGHSKTLGNKLLSKKISKAKIWAFSQTFMI